MKLIVFDVDGTLVDSQHTIVEAQARAFAAYGLAPPPRAVALGVVGLSLREAFVALAGAEAPIDGLARAYQDAWHDIRRRPGDPDTLFPGAHEMVITLAARADVCLGIATGKSRRGVAALIEARRWEGVFATVQTADDHPSKPHPAMLLATLGDTGIGADAAAMVGDTSYDMAMATAAGIVPLGVAWGYHDRAALEAAGAARVVADVDELMEVLLQPGVRVAA